ncbi:MAG: adenylyl-sulfate kinase, partial [Planctomycetes bacterium]|nr:adenylyl-sulfate kinase [Planctomycetota bacterium]
VWMSETPMEPARPYYLKHLTRTVAAEVAQIRYQIDVNTLHRRQADRLALNEIGRAEISVGQPLAFDPYTKNRATGAFILIDQVSNNTVAAGMILDREPSELVPTDVKWTAQPKSHNVQPHASLVSPGERSARLGHKPACVWLTGLTGAGKTTIAYNLEHWLQGMGCASFVINGENLRLGLSKDLDFSADDRGENIRRASEVAKMMNDAGLIAICDFLSPYRSQRDLARQTVGPDRFLEVHVYASAATRMKRDPKGLYKQADEGKINLFPGVSAPYEEPQQPSLAFDTEKHSVDECVAGIIGLLKQKGILLPKHGE